ncbi:MAG: FliM/FliN family flagellar motor switch protein [Tepidamorphaceae bacterium]
MLLPYATIEPIRGLLLQMFMGEKFGRDATWEASLASQMWAAHVGLNAVLRSIQTLSRTLNFSVGDTIPLDMRPDDLVTLKWDVELTDGRVGRIGDKIAVRVAAAAAAEDDICGLRAGRNHGVEIQSMSGSFVGVVVEGWLRPCWSLRSFIASG